MGKEIKAVIDTSVLIAAVRSKSNTSSPVMLLKNCHEGFFKIITSPQILEELIRKLTEYNYNENMIGEFIGTILVNGIITEGLCETNRLDNIDSKDNIILSAAYESKANYIISLDRKHILPLKHFHGTQIISPSAFIIEIENFKLGIYKEYKNVIY